MPKLNEDTRDILVKSVKENLNIILTGSHGVGKTTMMMDILNEVGQTPIKYYSCATLDPWVDLVGIPVPDNDNHYTPQQKKAINKAVKAMHTIKYCRPLDLLEATVVVCDEINRSHPKVQNSLLEAIQFKTINGQPLPNLKMVVAMQNPATKLYQVTELDPALIDRFHVRMTLTGCPSVEYYAGKGIDQAVGKAMVDWWTLDLNDDSRQLVTPRTLEYIGMLLTKKLNWKILLGESLGVPLIGLEQRLFSGCGISKYEDVTLRDVLRDLEAYSNLAASDKDFASHIIKEIEIGKALTCWDAAEVIVALPQEFQMKLFTNKKWLGKMESEWSKLDISFHENDECRKLIAAINEVSGNTSPRKTS